MTTPQKNDKALRDLKKEIEQGFIYYHSRSSSEIGKHLSNFRDVLDHTGKGFRVHGLDFRTIEHAFQGFKFLHLEGGAQREDIFKLFAVDGPIGKKDAGVAKTAGGKGNASLFAKHNLKLDGKKWDEHCEAIMESLVRARSRVDATFRQILRKAAQDHVVLLHFERNRSGDISKYKWGGSFPGGIKPKDRRPVDFRGLNLMGKMIMAEGERLKDQADRKRKRSD